MHISRRDQQTVTRESPAKINLYLHVGNKRPDGYHEIDSWFQAVDLYDTLHVSRTDGVSTLVVDGNDRLETDSRNLVMRAWETMRDQFCLPGGVVIRLTKRIPVAAGLGGGSSNAAAMMLAINDLFDLKLPRVTLAAVGLSLGSDIPFFLGNGQSRVQGRGERISPVRLPVDYSILLINNGIASSTAEAYKRLERALTPWENPPTLSVCRSAEELFSQLSMLRNDFEPVLRDAHPSLSDVEGFLVGSGASLVRMSGSGATFFGMWQGSMPNDLIAQATRHGWWAAMARPIRLE